MAEQQYLMLVRTSRMSRAMQSALTGFFLKKALEGVGAATEQEVRDYIANERGDPALAAKFKTVYLVPAPPNPPESAASCR
jgi:hypothetical protein